MVPNGRISVTGSWLSDLRREAADKLRNQKSVYHDQRASHAYPALLELRASIEKSDHVHGRVHMVTGTFRTRP